MSTAILTAAAPGSKVGAPPPPWSGDLIAALDWKRIAELARALSLTYGFELGSSTVGINGQTDFVITRGNLPSQAGTLVRLTRWNQWMASGACLAQFALDLRERNHGQGIFLAPGGCAPSAQRIAQVSGIELVDAEAMAMRVNALPRQHRDYFFTSATQGDAKTPSCPSCLRPLQLADDSSGSSMNGRQSAEIRYSTSDIVGDPVRARRIEIQPDCEVQFLREVRTQELVIHGTVTGDFVCEGCVVLHPGATLRGSVAAHSVVVRPGADMQGDTRIFHGKLEPFGQAAFAWIWRCNNPRPRPGCEAVSFLQH